MIVERKMTGDLGRRKKLFRWRRKTGIERKRGSVGAVPKVILREETEERG